MTERKLVKLWRLLYTGIDSHAASQAPTLATVQDHTLPSEEPPQCDDAVITLQYRLLVSHRPVEHLSHNKHTFAMS